MRKLGLVVLLVCALSSAAQNLPPEVKEFVKVDAPVIALEHVRVIDGTGAEVKEDQTVLISKGKIESISSAAEASVPQDGKVLDLHGYTVIPGLVGMPLRRPHCSESPSNDFTFTTCRPSE